MEQIILSNLITNERYTRKVIPYLDAELFHDVAEKLVFDKIREYFAEYNVLPTKEVLYTEVQNTTTLNENQFDDALELIRGLEADEKTKFDWLVNQSEEFVKTRSVHNALRKSIHILDDPKSKQDTGSITTLLEEALSISFDTNVGHDFLDDAAGRYELYHTTEERICFSLDYFNRITSGGLPPKTLNLLMAATGVGKSMFMCSMAADNLLDNKNVLYITMELAEERVAQRIDCKLLDVTMDELMDLPEKEYLRKVEAVNEMTKGKLVIKEYPNGSAGAGHFRHLLHELRTKKNFVPDIIYIDYLNICCSSRVKYGKVNSYEYIKSIAEELRALAVENELPIVTATQTNRDGIGSSDIELSDISESVGLAMTVDWLVALTRPDDDDNIMFVKQLKSRYNDINRFNTFAVGVNRAKMHIYDAPRSEQEGLMNGPLKDEEDFDKPIMDTTAFGEQDNERSKGKRKFDKAKFKGFTS